MVRNLIAKIFPLWADKSVKLQKLIEELGVEKICFSSQSESGEVTCLFFPFTKNNCYISDNRLIITLHGAKKIKQKKFSPKDAEQLHHMREGHFLETNKDGNKVLNIDPNRAQRRQMERALKEVEQL